MQIFYAEVRSLSDQRKNVRSSHIKGYVMAFLVSLPMVAVIFGIGVFVISRHLIPGGFFSIMLLLILPQTPLFFVWMYVMFKALTPVTGGMPAMGFRQWFLVYIWAISLLLYWALWAFILDVLIPNIDYEYREAIFPLFILTSTQLLLARSTRFRRLIDEAFQTGTTEVNN